MIIEDDIYTAHKTLRHSCPAPTFTPCFVVARLWNLATINKKKLKVVNCNASPPIKILSPTLTVDPVQSLEAAMPEPAHWMRKVRMSRVMKMRVNFATGMRKMCVDEGGRTRRQRREMRR